MHLLPYSLWLGAGARVIGYLIDILIYYNNNDILIYYIYYNDNDNDNDNQYIY